MRTHQDNDPLQLRNVSAKAPPPVVLSKEPQMRALHRRITTDGFADSLETKLAVISSMILLIYEDLNARANV